MTCHEIHAHWGMRPDASHLPSDWIELSQHVAACSDCRQFIEEEKELSKYLLIMRSATPQIPTSLDASVCSAYRFYLSNESVSAEPHPLAMRLRVRGALGWAASVAFAGAVAYGGMLLLVPGGDSRIERQVKEQPMVVTPTPLPGRKETVSRGPLPNKSMTAAAQHQSRPTSVRSHDEVDRIKFRSLIYCDPISCSGAMDVIRVQLPSPVLGTTAASARTDGLVSADVLVGPDGIARGIRVVE